MQKEIIFFFVILLIQTKCKRLLDSRIMKKIILPLLFAPVIFHAQQTAHQDPEIISYVSQVSTDSLKSHINSLVSFGTRHTMSSTTDPKRGIGAARKWVLKKFNDYAKNAGGRMEVFLQNQTIHPDGKE